MDEIDYEQREEARATIIAISILWIEFIEFKQMWANPVDKAIHSLMAAGLPERVFHFWLDKF